MPRASRTHKNIKSVPGYFYCVLACICTTPALYLLLNSLVKHTSVKACCKSCGEHFVSTACTQVLGYDPDDAETENEKALQLGLPQDLRGPIEHGTEVWRNQKERGDGSHRNRGGFKARINEIWKLAKTLPEKDRWRFNTNNHKTGANTQHAVHSCACVRSFSKSCGHHRDSFVRAL